MKELNKRTHFLIGRLLTSSSFPACVLTAQNSAKVILMPKKYILCPNLLCTLVADDQFSLIAQSITATIDMPPSAVAPSLS